ncbi:DNA primase family protein [Methanosphaerula palustris]|uniref:Phage/plasmid primase, P4 family n=1 Tax=Methanosphaerula palustris (strain ATCC BAA-1556 / DSM 19958 / E1-9c) TaxID=521011 RepID=B8GF17_METPE|nr:DNA primase family protein [Methanosphaerula palustris]ACL17823.1 phage/plasmid primase, P4 family [Methanosphaerula palustris E1-9c]
MIYTCKYFNFTPSNSPILRELFKTYQEYAEEYEKTVEQDGFQGSIDPYTYVNGLISTWEKSWKENPSRFTYQPDPNKSTKKPNLDTIMDYVIKHFAAITFKDVIYIYDQKTGTYRPDEGEINGLIMDLLHSEGYTNNNKIAELFREIQTRIKARNIITKYPFNLVANLIPCKNGVLDPLTQTIVPRSPAYGFTYMINAEYLPEVDCIFIKKYLRTLVAPKDYEMLLNLGASCLIRESQKKMYLIYNRSGNNGKTTLLNLLTDMLGKENTSSLSLQDFDKGGFRVAEIDGKIANISGDLPTTRISDTSVIKQLTGEDFIMIERKYGQPYEIQNRAILIFGANEPPVFNDTTDAFYSRMVMIEFPNQFKVDLDFNKKLKEPENLSALLKVFVDHIPTLLKSGITTDTEAMKNQYLRESDSVYRFFEDNLVKDQFGEIDLDLVYDVYIDYCTVNKVKKVGKKAFSVRMSEHFDVSTRRRGSTGEQIAYLKGVKFKSAKQQTFDQIEMTAA